MKQRWVSKTIHLLVTSQLPDGGIHRSYVGSKAHELVGQSDTRYYGLSHPPNFIGKKFWFSILRHFVGCFHLKVERSKELGVLDVHQRIA